MSHEERSPQGEHRSAPVLTKEEVRVHRITSDAGRAPSIVLLCDSHEALRAERDALRLQLEAESDVQYALRAERDALKARVAVLAAECKAWRAHRAYTNGFDRDGYSLARAQELANARDAARAATDANGGLS